VTRNQVKSAVVCAPIGWLVNRTDSERIDDRRSSTTKKKRNKRFLIRRVDNDDDIIIIIIVTDETDMYDQHAYRRRTVNVVFNWRFFFNFFPSFPPPLDNRLSKTDFSFLESAAGQPVDNTTRNTLTRRVLQQ